MRLKFWKRSEAPKPYYSNLSSKAIADEWRHRVLMSGKTNCLDLGSGLGTTKVALADNKLITIRDAFITVDIDGNSDLTGDIRALFAPGFKEQRGDYPELQVILPNAFDVVRAEHLIEHIAWIYQEFMFEWIYNILKPGGMFYAGTPNLEYIASIYSANRKRQKWGLTPKYPHYEHEYCEPGIPFHMQKWVQSKIFSGCSPGDYHHCCHDAFMLSAYLEEAGFKNVSISDERELKVMAYKPMFDPAVETAKLEDVVKKVMAE